MKAKAKPASTIWLQLAVAVVAALSAVAVAWIQFRRPSVGGSVAPTQPGERYYIGGRVIDGVRNVPIAHAEISLAGRTEVYVTEDNGNFRIAIDRRTLDSHGAVRLYVSKAGYRLVDMSVSPPVENLIILATPER